MGVGGAAGRRDRAWRARAPRAVQNCACLAASRRRWRSGRLLPQARGWRGRASSSISPRARCSSASNARWPVRSDVASASSRIAIGAARDRPPGLRPRPARSSIARRTSGRSVRAAARRRGACPRARRRPRRSQRSPNPRKTRRTRETWAGHAHARGGRARRRSARRARGRRASIRTTPRAFFQARACRHA